MAHKFANGLKDATFSAKFDQEIEAAFAFYVKTHADDTSFAVRSSADSRRFTRRFFAGQQRKPT